MWRHLFVKCEIRSWFISFFVKKGHDPHCLKSEWTMNLENSAASHEKPTNAAS